MTGIYVHIPFCVRKCHYCDFNSKPLDVQEARLYEDALIREVHIWAKRFLSWGRKVDTLYIGGGTPTCLEPRSLSRIIREITASFDLPQDAEVTCEANPGTLTPEMVDALIESGVNRLSIGAQSTSPEILMRLGRIHSREDFFEAFRAARKGGFRNINVDLMFAVPGQTLRDVEESLQDVLALGPEHISAYSLSIEEGTPFARDRDAGLLCPVDEDTDREMYEFTIEFLRGRGYRHYEISNFALPGRECQHNLIYWRNEDYLGLGAGAHSHLGRVRHYNCLEPGKFASLLAAGTVPVEEQEELSLEAEMSLTVILGLRLVDEGVRDERFVERFGRSLRDAYGPAIDELSRLGLLSFDGRRLMLTREGVFIANEVFIRFLPDG